MKIITTLLTVLILPYLSLADGLVLDQSQPAVDTSVGTIAIGGPSDQILAQVVTTGVSGSLSAIALPLAGSGTLLLQIEGVSGNVPNGVVYTSQTFLGSNLPDFTADPTGFRQLNLSSPVEFSAGDPFAFVLSVLDSSSENSFGILSGPSGDSYPGGDAFFDSLPNPVGNWVALSISGSSDLPFETYVTPAPEPATAGLFMLAILVAMTRARRPYLKM